MLPWLQEAERRGEVALLTDCRACMHAYPRAVRQQWACGHELTAPPGVVVEAWSGLGYAGPAPTTCPGYTTSLPETIEAARAWHWWSKGQLREFCDGAPVGEPLKLAIEIFDGEVRAFERWMMTPADKGGGHA